MLSLLVFVAAAFVSILEIHGTATTNIDINAILDIIRAQQEITNTDNNKVESSSDSSSELVDNESSFRSRELIRLLHQTLDDAHKRKVKERKQSKNKYQTYDNDLVHNKEDDNSNENVFPVKRLLQHLLTQSDTNQRKRPDKVTNRKLKPGSLLESYVEEKKDVADGLSEYSRIYVILNSETFRSSQNKKQLTDLISRLLANSSPASQSVHHSLKEGSYKDFPVRSSLSERRSRRDSSEVALVPINEIYGESAVNLDDLLNALDSQQRKVQDSQSDSSSSSDSTETSGSDKDKDVALRGTQLVRFLQQARDKQLTENKRLSKLYTHLTNLNGGGRNKYLTKKNKNKDLGGDYVDLSNNRNNHIDDFVEYLLSQTNKRSYVKDKAAKPKNHDDYLISLNNKKEQTDDKLTKLSDRDDDVDDGNLQDYSRIYVILNPEALKSSKNKKDLSALVSRLMSKSSSVSQKRISPKQLQYKGFPVRGVFPQRRSRRDSNEGNSMEDNYKPKRPKHNNYYGGGGGGAGGRTPIPYIRHRGDIYERD